MTDANVVLGRIGTTRRLGGSIAIDAARARQAVADLAARMGSVMTVDALAEGVVRIAVARMTSAIREISIQRGHDPRDFTLIAFGGAGPMHALALADEIGIPRVLVPRHPGNFSALGLLASDIKHDEVRTRVGPLRERWALLAGLFAEMEAGVRRQLELEGFDAAQQRMRRSLDLRYRSQAFELNLETDAEPALAAVEAAFHRATRRCTATPIPRRRSSWSTRASAPTAWWPSRPRPARKRPAPRSTPRCIERRPVPIRRRRPRLPGVGARAPAGRRRAERPVHRRGVRRDHRGAAGLARCARRARQPEVRARG